MQERIVISATAVIRDLTTGAIFLRTVECDAAGSCCLIVPGDLVAPVVVGATIQATLESLRAQERELRAIPLATRQAACDDECDTMVAD